MKLISPSVEILKDFEIDNVRTPQNSIFTNIFKSIEIAGRTCYKSEDKMTIDSPKKFVDMLINRGHTPMLEHGTVYLLCGDYDIVGKYYENKYSVVTNKIVDIDDSIDYITTNYRVLLENNWLDDLQYLCMPTKYHEKRVSVRFICDRRVSHELVRHRAFSFAQESMRYCNYSKDKFGNEITFIEPPKYWFIEQNETFCYDAFCDSLIYAEQQYLKLIEFGWQPQQARAVLPNALKTEVVMTGFLSDWIGHIFVYKKNGALVEKLIYTNDKYEWAKEYYKEHNVTVSGFFPLRISPDAHPQMRELAIPLYEQFKEKGYVNNVN